MKKILSMLLPSILISILLYLDKFITPEDSLYILALIYLIFPIIFIIQGIIFSKSLKNMAIGFLLSSISIIVLVSIWYNMGSMIPAVLVYLLAGGISAQLKNRISKGKSKFN